MAKVLKMEDIVKCDARGPCKVCGAAGSACSRCRVDFYCGPQHQRQDWGRHRAGCGAVEAGADGWLVAARDLPAGTRVLRELPAVIFPRTNVIAGWMLCRGCCCPLGEAPAAQCPGCGLPRCRPDCDHDGLHRGECALLQRAGFRVDQDGMERLSMSAWLGLAMLRTFLWTREHPQLGEALAHPDMGPDNEFVAELWTGARDWLRGAAGLHWLAEDELRRAFQLARTACVVYPRTWSKGTGPVADGVQAVYASSELIKQSCVPSVFSLGLSECSMEHLVVTTRDMRRGERLTMDHCDDPLQSAEQRREAVRQLSLHCDCGQCTDPARQGTHLDSWTCSQCPGLVVPLADASAGGRCNGCGAAVSRKKLDKAERGPRRELEKLEEDKSPKNGPAAWEGYLRRQLRPRGPLHPTHLLALKAKRHLATAVRSVMCRMGREHTAGELARWESMMRDVLGVLAVLRPGYNSHWAGVALSLCQLLTIRAIHVNKEGASRRTRALAKALFDEATRLREQLGLVLVTTEGLKALDSISFQLELASQLLAGESPLDALAGLGLVT